MSRTSPLAYSCDVSPTRYEAVRSQSLRLAAPLSAEDQCIQSMEDASPTKWHLAHTTWFFETFILKNFVEPYSEFHPDFNFLFNSYYEQIGPRHARPHRGMLTRPSLDEVFAYRAHVDAAMSIYLESGPSDAALPLIELGLHHEQQHQELLLTDIKHALSCNPTHPAYHRPFPREAQNTRELTWVAHPGGLVEIGYNGGEFHFDCEGPRHRVWLDPFQLASRPITNGEYFEFMSDDGYKRADLWLADGWAAVQENGWDAPLYWEQGEDGNWSIFTLAGLRPISTDAPVCHVSYFEADAYARWAGKRLPTEAEWEVCAADLAVDGHFVDTEAFHPLPAKSDGLTQMFGDVWEWTQSSYNSYPGFRPPEGAVGEYNGKFMSGQMVLRGGSCATPTDHLRASYRNFFYPPARWQFSGIRLADDAPDRTVVTVKDDDNGFKEDVLQGLSATQKYLPPKYFYDEAGAALFEEICTLDEYYPTRTEVSIMQGHASEMAAALGPNAMLIEYGSGSLDKVRILLDAMDDPIGLAAIDISEEQLQRATDDVRAAYPNLEVMGINADFTQPVPIPNPKRSPKSKVAFFPGSTIGNFEPQDAKAFLRSCAKTVGENGYLLIGVDLQKDAGTLVRAYDDAKGVTAAFNKNVLRRINSELSGTFDLDLFKHGARYDSTIGRIEMHLESLTDHIVTVAGTPFHFQAGETIHTESSYKYSVDGFIALAGRAGFSPRAHWTDPKQLFAVFLFQI